MAGKLSLAIAINMLTDNFKKGADSVKSGFKSMQQQILGFVAAVGIGGLSLSGIVGKFKEVAKATERVVASIKIVSQSFVNFRQNLKYVNEAAEKYGLDVTSLINNFSKFTGAANAANIPLDKQREIFDTLAKASAAFNLETSDMDRVFQGVVRSVTKSGISLQRFQMQVGTSIPVAMQAMANAAGMSLAQLEKMAKKGEVLSKNILPGFAKELNNLLGYVDTDTIQGGLNRLNNTIGEIVEASGFRDTYKELIKLTNSVLKIIAENFKAVFTGIVSVVGGIVAAAMLKALKGWWLTSTGMSVSHKKLSADLTRTEAARHAAFNAMETARLKHAEATKAAEVKLAQATGVAKVKLAQATGAVKAKLAQDVAFKEVMYAKAVVAEEKARLAFQKTAAAQRTGLVLASINAIKLGASKLWVALKTMWSTLAPIAIISAIIALVMYFTRLYSEAKRVKNIFNDYKKSIENLADTSEITMLKTQLAIMNDKKKSQDEINAAQSNLQKALGNEKLSQKQINKLIKERIAKLKEASMAEAAFNTVGEYTERNAKLATGVGLTTDQMERLAKLSKIDDTSSHNSLYYTKAVEAELKKNGKGVTRLEVYPAVKEYIQNNKVIEDATNRAAKHQVKVNDKPKDDGSGDKDKAELKKAEEKYAKDLEELSARREIEKLTVNDYNKALDDLNRKYYVEARGSKNEKILKSKYFKNLEDAVNNPLFDQSQFDLEKVQSDYYASLGELTAKRQSGAIKEEDYQKSLIELSNSTTDAVGAIKNMGLEGEGFIATLIANRRLAEAALKVDIKPKERDTTFDYKKTALDIKGEELEVAKEYVEELKKKIDEGATYLQEQFNNAMSNVTNLKDALKLAEVQVDIKNFNKALNEGLYSGMKDIVSNSDRVVGAFSNLRDVMNDVNATEWERIMAVWNTMTTLADSILSVIDVIKTLTKVTEQLSDAEQNEAAINAAVTTQKVANAEIEIASDLAVAGVAKATTTDEATANAVKAATDTALTQTKVTNAATEISADIATAAVSKATAGEELVANTVKGVSSAAAGAAKLPFPASIIAIAGAIAAVTALFAGISKFANGGIVSGNSTSGDKVLARVNSGEMILNRGQQSKLFSALNSGEGLSSQVRGGDVKFRISGTDLVGVYNNYIKRRSKIQ